MQRRGMHLGRSAGEGQHEDNGGVLLHGQYETVRNAIRPYLWIQADGLVYVFQAKFGIWKELRLDPKEWEPHYSKRAVLGAFLLP